MYPHTPRLPEQPFAPQQPYPQFPDPRPYPFYEAAAETRPPRKKGLRAWAVTLIASGTFVLGMLSGVFLSGFSLAVTEIASESRNQNGSSYDYGFTDSYGPNETAEVSGVLYDLSFSPCSFEAEVTLTSYLRGSQAADKILEMGGDLSGLPNGKEYVTATFQIKLCSADSSVAVMFNPQYFRFDIAESGDDVRIGNYPENGVELENLLLQAGESGSITAFAVIDETAGDPDLYFYTDGAYITFTP